MDTLPALASVLDKLEKEATEENSEKHLQQLIELVDERYNDDEDDVPKAVLESSVIKTVLPFLRSSDHTLLTAKSAQLFAELAKTESVRVPLVQLGVVPPLLDLLKIPNIDITIATQVCRALGNICFDNDVGRTAVNTGDGMVTLLSLLRHNLTSTQEGASRLRVIACGFILNLTNECELLQERALEAGVLELLNQCLQQHPNDEDLVNMALATFMSVADSDAGKSQMLTCGVLDSLVHIMARDDSGAPILPALELLNSLAESEPVKNELADGALPAHLLQVINSHSGHGDPGSRAKEGDTEDKTDDCVKLASDLLLSLLVGDGSMEKLYGGGEGLVFKQCIKWLAADTDSVRVLGALAIGNFARSDAHCRQLVDSGLVDSLLMALRPCGGEPASFTLQHAVLSSLRNLAIPPPNKARLLEAGVMQAVLDLRDTEVMAVTFKLLGVLRMLMDGQEAAAVSLGQERDFLNCMVDWCGVEEHAGVKGEATRLMASMIKNSKSSQVMRNIVRVDGLPHLVAMATSEHVVMQNEALVALNLVASTVLGEAVASLREADLVGTVVKILKADDTPPELLCNTLTLVHTLASADSLKEELVTSGLLEHVRQLGQGHVHQGVKDAANSVLACLEDELAR